MSRAQNRSPVPGPRSLLMTRLPPIASLTPDLAGWSFYLCTQKELRTGRGGEFISLMLQDATGRLQARVFDEEPIFE